MKRILVLLLVLWVGGLALTQSPAVHAGLAETSHEGSTGGILVGLALCLPLAGAFVLARTYFRWQRLLHIRLKSEGVSFRRPGARP